MDWVASAITLLSIYMIGCKDPKVSRYGFLAGILGSIVWCIAVPLASIWVVNGVCSLLNLRAFINKA